MPVGPGPNRYWPNARVPYVIDSSMDSSDISYVHDAIRDYHQKTCIRWIRRTSERAYANFVRKRDESGCAYAGSCYYGGVQTATFEQCISRDVAVHEMGHILCFGHEQDRNDKYNFIEDCNNNKYEHINLGHLYDYRSIMHYFCDDCRVPTMEGVSKNQCGSPAGLSVLDAEKLNDAYDCQGYFYINRSSVETLDSPFSCNTGCLSYRFRFPFMIDSSSRPVGGGYEPNGLTLYICRAYIRGDIVPGKAVLRNNQWTCWVSYGGSEIHMTDREKFEVLTNPKEVNLNWVRGDRNSYPPNAIAGGRTVHGETLYIVRCRATINGQNHLIPGKIHANHPQHMYYPYGFREHRCTDFDFLVCN